MKNKKELREKIKHKRDSMSDAERKSASNIICDICQPFIDSVQTIMLYNPINSEVDVKPLFEYIWNQNKRLLLPLVKNKQIYAAAHNKGDKFIKGAMNIDEPDFSKRIEPEKIDLCIVPGLAFTKKGERLGYGAGYYDNFLPKTRAQKVAVCFYEQIVDALPTEKHDVTMDKIVTQKGIIC